MDGNSCIAIDHNKINFLTAKLLNQHSLFKLFKCKLNYTRIKYFLNLFSLFVIQENSLGSIYTLFLKSLIYK